MSFQRQVPGPDALKVARAIEKVAEWHRLDPTLRVALRELALRIVEGDENANLKHEVEP